MRKFFNNYTFTIIADRKSDEILANYFLNRQFFSWAIFGHWITKRLDFRLSHYAGPS